MARRTSTNGDTATDATTPESEAPTTAAVVDENGQVTEDSPQATPVAAIRTGVMDPRQYARAGEGYQPGETAPKDLWLDQESGKVVEKQPERGQAVTLKGSPVEPWAARLLAEQNYGG